MLGLQGQALAALLELPVLGMTGPRKTVPMMPWPMMKVPHA